MTTISPSDPIVGPQPCALSGQLFSSRELARVDGLRPSLADRIRRDHPDLANDALISHRELGHYRRLYVEEKLLAEHGELSDLERKVAESIAQAVTVAENTEEEYTEERTLGAVLADHVASFGGSWTFIILFGLAMAIWMGVNAAMGPNRAFDAYPYILLNLVLSTLAAIQAPIIMMSQKRQEQKDRLRSSNDYQVNLKAEIEIRALHEKMDYLLNKQWQRMSEMQQMQLELLQEGRSRR